jgi:hypothetical protein
LVRSTDAHGVRFRPQQTVSERELLGLLAASGRTVPLAALAHWRRDGLLPPFASQGQGRGRTYYWREPDILPHAQAAFDLLQTGIGRDAVLLGLFFTGFVSPLPQIRRAWQHRERMQASATAFRFKDVDGCGELPETGAESFASQHSGWLLDSIHEVGKGLPEPDPVTAIAAKTFDRVMARLRSPRRSKGGAGSAWAQMKVLARSLEGSGLVKSARDDQLYKAQAYLRALAPLLLDASDDLDLAAVRGGLSAPLWLAQIIGPHLFTFLLLQIRMGHGDALEERLAASGRLDRRMVFPPAQTEAYPLRV